jgi:class 3 adenylate cyclase
VDSNFKTYNYVSSFGRIDEILGQAASNYEEVDSLPDRDRLTYSNGFYANCSALFIDIRGSSTLPDLYKRPALAKLYRAYISEVVAIMNGNVQAREVNIVGDCVWAVFNTPWRQHIDSVFATAAQANSLVQVLNYKLGKAGYAKPIRVGIGMAYGRALMIKAGHNGSGISDVVYMGDVVNRAAKLAAQGSNGYAVPALMVDNVFADNLDDDNKKLLEKDWTRGCYSGDVINLAMNEWYQANCT